MDAGEWAPAKFEGFTMQNVFDKDTSRWVMKRAHELAKKDRSLGRRMRDGYIVTYADCFKQALRRAHGEAKELLAKVNDVASFVTERVAYFTEHFDKRALQCLDIVLNQVKSFDVFAYVDFHKAYSNCRRYLESLESQAEHLAGF